MRVLATLRTARLAAVLRVSVEALRRYKLRTGLSVLGVVFGVAAVIAMQSVTEGARRDALSQVEALGLDNLVARGRSAGASAGSRHQLIAADAARLVSLLPLARTSSPLIERYLRVTHGDRSAMASVVGVQAAYGPILRLPLERGRFIAAIDESSPKRVCVLGGSLARQLFGYRDPVGDQVRVGSQAYQVVGVLRDRPADARPSNAMAWRDLDTAAIVPLPALSGRTLVAAPDQPVDEIWLQVRDGARIAEIARIFEHTVKRLHGGVVEFEAVVPRELLAQRYRLQRTFGLVTGTIAALALLVGGIGIMNVMLTSVFERTAEIGLRRTVGATRRDVTVQFLVEALLMTLTGGALGIALGAAASTGITAYAGWSTHISPGAVALGFVVSVLVGVMFGLYPAVKAARLEPVDAVRYE